MPAQLQRRQHPRLAPTQHRKSSVSPALQQPRGNHAAAAGSGLGGGPLEMDVSIMGPFAELLLSVLPLELALDWAAPCLSNPVVRRWLEQCAPEALETRFSGEPPWTPSVGCPAPVAC